MVNNYVKHGYISKPEKKKYQRKQIARLIAITTLKSVFSIQEIAQTLNTLHTDTNSEELYNAFVDYMIKILIQLIPLSRQAAKQSNSIIKHLH